MKFHLPLIAMSAIALSGCATEKYVNTRVADLEGRHAARLTAVEGTAQGALDRANAAFGLAEGKFVFSTVLNADQVKFDGGKAVISEEGKAYLAQLAEQLKTENKNVFLEIQGHTDSGLTAEKRLALGQQRAEAVRLILNQQGVALNRMSTISYGGTAPVAPNDTADGRALNRRVVIIGVK